MKKENAPTAAFAQPTHPLTRAQARAPGGGLPPKPIGKLNEKRVLRANSKRPATDENSSSAPLTAPAQRKRRAVLKDVSNLCCDNSYRSCINAAKIQNPKFAVQSHVKRKYKVTPAVSDKIQQPHNDAKGKLVEDSDKMGIAISEEIIFSANQEGNLPVDQITLNSITIYDAAKAQPEEQISAPLSQIPVVLKKEADTLYENKGVPEFINIDSDHRDPLMCCLYAPDIYDNLHVAELLRRPSNFMETIQRDITQSMRGILVDWLVEVSEEYKLTPDTLYLTVNLIDRFLSQNYIERQKLQLLGITCMLIASKYEEICAPRVEEFCFITDNTYKREEVVVMESQVLNYLGFQLSAPTIQSFLRRFLRAAQASYTAASIELEFLANYIAELSLVEYEFVKILPSLLAASAVFLARWTLNQACHPWNSTLEHYTKYKASDLETTVTALQELQMNSKGCPLNAIRDKYRQQKFKGVAHLLSPELFQKLFRSSYGSVQTC